VKEVASKKTEKDTKVAAKEKASKAAVVVAAKKDKQKAHLRAQYAADIANPHKFPPVCMSEKARLAYAPKSPPMNSVLYEVLTILLEKHTQIGGGINARDWNLKSPAVMAKMAQMEKTLEKFQSDHNINDGLGCVGEQTWKALIACPLPLTTAMCHIALPCVLALQTVLFKYLPEGRKNGRYCKQTMNQMRLFQRLYQLNPTGNTYELDFITALRRNGMRDSISKGNIPPAFQPKGE